MESLDKINFEINQMLMRWNLVTGRYEYGVIKATKFGIINIVCIDFVLFEAIKWFNLMFYSDEWLANYLGEIFMYFVFNVVDLIGAFEAVNSIILIMLFYFFQNKMLFCLDHMQFDN